MSKLIAVALSAALCVPLAFAQDKKPAAKQDPTGQQQRTNDCTRQASDRGLQGRERNQFMTACLRGQEPMTQQERMAACNKQADAKALKGDDRKKFVSSCLGG